MSSSLQPTRMHPTLLQQLEVVVRRERIRRVFGFLGAGWIVVTLASLIALFVNRSAESGLDPFLPNAWMWIAIAAVVMSMLAGVLAIKTSPGAEQIAHKLESDFPELDSILLTAIEQSPDENRKLNFLQQDVIRNAVYHSYRNNWKGIISTWRLSLASMTALVGFIGIGLGMFALWITAAPESDSSIHLFDDVAINTGLNYQLTVQPGNTEIEHGKSLLVLAHFETDVPAKTELSYSASDGSERIAPMKKSLDDPVFAHRISQVTQPFTYHVIYDENRSEEYKVTVFEYPKLVRSDADLTFPGYTQMPARKLQDVRRISTVVGTEATLKFFVNKEIASAALITEGDQPARIDLQRDTSDRLLWKSTLTVEQTQKFRLILNDNESRQNKMPPLFTVNALFNQPPKIRLVEPTRDVQVSAIEEINLQASAYDDFEIERIGISYSIAGEPISDFVLSDAKVGKQKHSIEYLMELEQLDAQPDQLVSYHFWAEDVGPDGEKRRTASDMFFAEIRRFEEIYRQDQGGQQGQQQQGGQGNQNAEQAMQLAKLQKEIINATWNVIRRETESELTDAFHDDVDLLIESQQSAVDQVDEFTQQLDDDQTRSFADELKSYMAEAISELTESKTSDSAKPLTPALVNEQAAYQTLLKMRAREFQVSRQNAQSQQAQNSQNRQQRQMQQMDLQEQNDRYEQERLAQDQEQQSAAQRENRQILSRLRELARRQNDLNKRIKELQSALEEAESESEKEEIEKQLKRLQEEQEQILRDTDELQERMQQPENQERMGEEAQKLEQARDNIQQSSEALKEREVSRAAAEGTRAERELKDLRDEFQKRTSGQFTQQMRQMRNQVRDLEKQQQDLAEQIQAQDQKTERQTSLQTPDDREDILEALKDGQETVEDLREQIKTTIEEAEEFEPLLADELYETYRSTEKSRPDRALESAQRSLQRGFTDDAQLQQQEAIEGIEDLRKGIDKAAENVLGDETEALKLARNSIKKLSRQLDQEIERAQPESNSADAEQNEPGQQSQQGEPSDQQQTGETQPRENQQRDSENAQSGDQRPGEQQDANQQQPGQGSQQSERADQPNRQRGGNRLGQQDAQPEANRQPEQRLGGITGGQTRNWSPIAGEDFRDWAERLRDVEEMMADPDLRGEAARIRDEAKAIRKEFKRHSKEPNWDLVKIKLSKPLVELQNRVSRELMRRNDKNSLVPLNRQPVPTKYENAVQKYYEQLGTGK